MTGDIGWGEYGWARALLLGDPELCSSTQWRWRHTTSVDTERHHGTTYGVCSIEHSSTSRHNKGSSSWWSLHMSRGVRLLRSLCTVVVRLLKQHPLVVFVCCGRLKNFDYFFLQYIIVFRQIIYGGTTSMWTTRKNNLFLKGRTCRWCFWRQRDEELRHRIRSGDRSEETEEARELHFT